MRNPILLIAGFLICLTAAAGDKKYAVSDITPALMKNADVVKRLENIQFTILNTGSAVLRKHYVLTILNEGGDAYANFAVSYDQLRQVGSIEGALYDASGNLIKKLKKRDIKDQSTGDINNMVIDNRVKWHNFYCKDYPYTVEYEYEETYNNTFFFPVWKPQEGENFSVETSNYTITFPEDYTVRYKAYNYTGQPKKTVQKGKQSMEWSTHSMPALEVPFATPSWKEVTTVVFFAPSTFEIGGYKGNMATWQGFGKFQNLLNADRDILPATIKQKVASLTSAITDVKEKIKILYHYLQQNTRYISIQLGIGGWQPFDAAYVAKKGYGDCKALVNYMRSLLKEAGIPSYYTVVAAGRSQSYKSWLIEDFPFNHFNHVILCVPLQNDSMWLECTSQEMPAGYMGNFTGNRKALMITKEGGVVVSTPRYGINENKQLRVVKASLDLEGNLQMKINTSYKCLQQDRLSSLINVYSKEKVHKYLEQSLSLPTYNVNDFKYNLTKGPLPYVDEKLDITVHNYATISGKRIFILPNILNRSGLRVTLDTSRKSDFVFGYAYSDKDEIGIDIPEGYEVEATFKDVEMETPFGKYSATAKVEGNKIYYTRLMEQYSGRFPAAKQKEILQFYKKIYQSDRSRIVLVKKGE